ncbi:Proteasome [Theobroma cacao]|nr:Proteasome [Theobroma cacao]
MNMHLFQNWVGHSLTLHFFVVETLKMPLIMFVSCRYTDDMELDDAVHTAILTLKEGFEGQISGKNIEIGIIGTDKKFRQALLDSFPTLSKLFYGVLLLGIGPFGLGKVLTPAEIDDYLAEVE